MSGLNRGELTMRVLTAAATAALVLVLAACGGGAAQTAGGGDPTDPPAQASEAPNEPAASEPPAGEPAASEPAATTAGGGGGGTGGYASRPCDLVTQAEAEGAAGVTGLTSQVLTVDASSGICSWRDASSQVEVYVGVWDGVAGQAQWDAMKYLVDSNADGMETVDSLGDAIYSTQGDVLLVKKGDTMVQITVRSPELTDPAAVKAAVLAVGQAVVSKS